MNSNNIVLKIQEIEWASRTNPSGLAIYHHVSKLKRLLQKNKKCRPLGLHNFNHRNLNTGTANFNIKYKTSKCLLHLPEINIEINTTKLYETIS